MDRYYVEHSESAVPIKRQDLCTLRKTMGSKSISDIQVWCGGSSVQAISEIKKWALDKTLNPKSSVRCFLPKLD